MSDGPRPLFSLVGFPVSVDPSWLFVAALITWSLATGVFPAALPQASTAALWALGGLATLGFFASVLLHEVAHSVVAKRYGVGIRGIRLWLFGGVAEMDREPPSARAEFFIAVAGPVMSVALGAALWGVETMLLDIGPQGLITVVGYLGTINLVLAGFNLLPAFPLDGGRVARAALWAWRDDLVWATRVTGQIGGWFGAGFIALGVLDAIGGDVMGGVWIGVLGLFLRSAARQQVEAVVARSVLADVAVAEVMRRPVKTLTPDLTVQQAIDEYVVKLHHKLYPVVDAERRLLGTVHLRELATVPATARAATRIDDIYAALEPHQVVAPDDDVSVAWAKMNQSRVGRLVVVDPERRPVGMLALKDLLEVLALRQGKTP